MENQLPAAAPPWNMGVVLHPKRSKGGDGCSLALTGAISRNADIMHNLPRELAFNPMSQLARWGRNRAVICSLAVRVAERKFAMKLRTSAPLALLTLASGLVFSGCSHTYYVPPPPPPPPVVYQPSQALLDLAGRNGFNAGESDGSRDAYNGYPYEARRTPAYHDAPGYDPNLGPLEPYVNTFRLAYLRGYDKGYYRR